MKVAERNPDPNRLRIACCLLGQRDSEGVFRSPLPEAEALARIRSMSPAERATLTSHIDWVQDYEANEMPECGGMRRAVA